MRKYEPIWIALKREGVCRIVAPSYLVKRIKKAVVKEKYKDEAFKQAYTSDLRMTTEPTANQLETIIRFELRKFPNYIKGQEKL